MENWNREKGLRTTLAFSFVTALLLCLLVACSSPGSPGSPGGPGGTNYTLTIQGVNCGTSPSGSLSVASGTATAISVSALAPWTWPTVGGWTVVSGTASIASPNSLSTAVTLTTGDATIRATGVDPTGYFVLTVKGVNCTTIPSGSTAVLTGSTTPISATASVGHSMPISNVWAVVNGSPSITNPNIASTSATLNLGDATVQATCP